MSSLVPGCQVIFIAILVAVMSSAQIALKNPTLFVIAFGLPMAKQTSKLIVSIVTCPFSLYVVTQSYVQFLKRHAIFCCVTTLLMLYPVVQSYVIFFVFILDHAILLVSRRVLPFNIISFVFILYPVMSRHF